MYSRAASPRHHLNGGGMNHVIKRRKKDKNDENQLRITKKTIVLHPDQYTIKPLYLSKRQLKKELT
jgi:hypothetical protein